MICIQCAQDRATSHSSAACHGLISVFTYHLRAMDFQWDGHRHTGSPPQPNMRFLGAFLALPVTTHPSSTQMKGQRCRSTLPYLLQGTSIESSLSSHLLLQPCFLLKGKDSSLNSSDGLVLMTQYTSYVCTLLPSTMHTYENTKVHILYILQIQIYILTSQMSKVINNTFKY